MHAIGFINLAASFVRHADTQISLRHFVARQHAQAWWLAARFRHDIWSTRLATHRAAIQRPGVSSRNRQWLEILPVIEEVLLAEPLTRCVAHHATVLEELDIDGDFAALAHSTLTAHIEARHRCLHLIVFGSGLAIELAVRLNRLRRLCESFTDHLLASMRSVQHVDLFSFDSVATRKLRERLRAECYSEACRRLHMCSLACWFHQNADDELDDRRPVDAEHNQRIAESILGLLPADLFDDFGVPLSQQIAALKFARLEPAMSQLANGPLASPLDLLQRTPSRNDSSEAAKRRWQG